MRPAPYLVSLRLENRKVLVVGGGQIGTGKIETLLPTGAKLVVVDPTPSARVDDLASQGALELHRRFFRPGDVARSALVVAATGDSKTNRRIRRWARLTRTLVNAVDDLENCDLTVPAVVRRGPATIAISTGGATPAGARFLREELQAVIDNVLPPETGHVLDAARDVRSTLRSEGGYRFEYAPWRQYFFEPAVAALRHPAAHNNPRGVLQSIGHRFINHERNRVSSVRVGTVALVGAGPGGDDLITVRGARELAKADVVFYDRLADPELLAFAPAAAERIPVGKGRGFGHTQTDINSRLIERARQGQHVVRLKGGDPFIFGRGGEELSALQAAGVPTVVVPGISSSFAAPALAGIPVTDRRCASAVVVITGHQVSGDMCTSPFMADTTSTIVVLMAATTAADVAAHLLDAGRPLTDPVAFIHRAGHPDQQVHRSHLAAVASDGCPFGSPTVMVVGDVVRLNEFGLDEVAPNDDERIDLSAAEPTVAGRRTHLRAL